jgi:hypothetical protein
LENKKKQQQRPGDEECARRDDAPSRPGSAPDAKEARPTVNTWLDGEETAIKGHKNSFQCAVTETIAKAARPGRANGTSTWRINAGTVAPSSIAASS